MSPGDRAADMDMTERLDQQIGQMMKRAQSLPRAPEQLKERTIQRGLAIENGRRAQSQLLGMEENGMARGDPDRIPQLAAEAVIGQMALHRPLPNGFTTAAECTKLAADPKFLKAIEGKAPGDLLAGIQNGDLAKSLAPSEKGTQKQTQETLSRTQNRAKDNTQPRM